MVLRPLRRLLAFTDTPESQNFILMFRETPWASAKFSWPVRFLHILKHSQMVPRPSQSSQASHGPLLSLPQASSESQHVSPL